METYTLEISYPEATTTQVIEGLTLQEATIRQELSERSGWKVQIITPTQRLRTWIHPSMRS